MRSLVLLLLVLMPAAASAQALDELPLADVLEVLVLDRELVALDARRGGQRSERLRLGENVLWTGSRGRVGVVLTDARVLAVAAGSAAWQFENLLRDEPAPTQALLGDRVALILTPRRALGFDGGSGNLVESRLGVRERVLATRAGENVGVVVTDRRALGLSPLTGGFFPVKLRLEERLEDVSAAANLVTLTTDRRVLIFRATTGTWEERRRGLR